MRLELSKVTTAYGNTVALREVDLVVPSGRVVALLGPNGAGKTTLLSAASGLLTPRAGQVLLDGADVTGRSPDWRVRHGMCHITEGRSVFPGMSVRDNLRLFQRPGDSADVIERAIEAFPRLGQRLNQIAGTMSGGEQQMLATSRAYAQQAPLVLLDEVSMGLAPVIVDEIFRFLELLVAQGTSLLIVEQYVARALGLADYVYLLAKGRIMFAGDPKELQGTDIFERYLGEEMVAG